MSNDKLVHAVLNCQLGSVVAPAGCGKTDCIVDVVKATSGVGKCLVLTHTLAGVDSLRKRMREKSVNLRRADLETIAGWSLRFTAAFPLRSGLVAREPRAQEWSAVYRAVTKLIEGGYITSVFKASYQRVLVDEYQDCTVEQHALIAALSKHLPICVFGDHLQAIFGFRNEQLVPWKTVTADFPLIDTLSEPWRWKRVENHDLGRWLIGIRDHLERCNRINLATAPACVSRIAPESAHSQDVLKANIRAGRHPRIADSETLIVIGDKASELMRGSLASRMRCSAIEPVNCQSLREFLEAIQVCVGKERLSLVLKFAASSMTGVKRVPFERRVVRRSEGWTPKNKPTELELIALEVLASNDLSHVSRLLERLRRHAGVVVFRRELLSALQSTLKLVINGDQPSLEDAAWHVQNKMRHAGRRFAQRSIGSTLLVKGMQFDHAVIVAPEKLSRNDLYVALTRASRTITIVSRAQMLIAKSEQAGKGGKTHKGGELVDAGK